MRISGQTQIKTKKFIKFLCRYEELSTSYNACMKKLSKKDKYLSQNIKQAEILRFKNLQLINEAIKLNKEIEEICFKFLDLLDHKSDVVRIT